MAREKLSSPRESTEIRELMSIIALSPINGANEEHCWELLRGIYAPGILKRFLPILRNVKRALEEGARFDTLYTSRKVARWSPVVDAILDQSGQLYERIGEHTEWPEGVLTNDLVGQFAKSHPLYTAIGSITQNDEAKASQFAILYHLLVAHSECAHDIAIMSQQDEYSRSDSKDPDLDHHKKAPQRRFRHSPYPATLAYRKLTEPDFEPILKNGVFDLNPEDWVFSDPMGDEAQTPAVIADIQRWVSYALKLNDRAPGERGGNGNGGHAWRPGLVDPSRIDPITGVGIALDFESDAENISVFSTTRGQHGQTNEEWGRTLSRFGENPYEYSEKQFLTLGLAITLKDYRDNAGRNLQGKNNRRGILNQYFHYDYSCLTDTEVRRIYTASEATFSESIRKASSSKVALCAAEAAFSIQVKLFHGKSVDNLIKLCVNRKVGLNIDTLTLIDDGVNACWQDIATNIRNRSHQDKFLGKSRVLAPGFLLTPDLMDLAEKARALMNIRATRRNKKVLSSSASSLKEEITKQLRGMNTPNSRRINAASVHRTLHSRIATKYGSVAAGFITGYFDEAAAGRVHYYAYTEQDLIDIYRDIVNEMHEISEHEEIRAREHLDVLRQKPTAHIGAELIPDLNTTALAISSLKREIEAASTWNTDAMRIRHHNLFTLYSAMSLFYVSAMRAVNEVAWPTFSGGPLRNFLIIRDKSPASGHKVRAGIVPDSVLEQLENYEDHLQALSGTYLPALGVALVRDEFRFVFVDEAWKPTRYSVSLYQAHLREFIDLPANQHRKFAANWMTDNRINDELKDAFMGHGSHAQMPGGPHSTFSPMAFQKELTPVLEEMLRQIDLSPIVSAVVRRAK